MSSFGNIGWGVGTWGAPVPGQEGADIGQPDSGHSHGVPTTAAGARAYIYAFTFDFGVPVANAIVLKAKSWAGALETLPVAWVAGTSDITAFILARHLSTSDIGVLIKIWVMGESNLTAVIAPNHLDDFQAAVNSVPTVDFPAGLQSVPPGDLPTIVEAIPGVNLGAIGGGHYPAYIAAFLSVTQPRNIIGYITGGWSAVLDMGATLTQIGVFEGIGAFLTGAQNAYVNLSARIGVISRSTVDFPVRLQPIHLMDLGASLITERHYSIYAIIKGQCVASEYDISAIIYQQYESQVDFPVSPIKALIGVYVDLHTEILARDFFRVSLGAYTRAAQADAGDLSVQLSSVGPFVNISRVILSLIPFLNIDAELMQVGGFLSMRGSLSPSYSVATSTSLDAGFVTTAIDYRFYLGTSGGLFIPPQITPQTVFTSYRNSSLLPDLHATLTGYHAADFGASIGNYPFSSIPATVNALSVDHIVSIAASIAAFKRTDLLASLVVSGSYMSFGASLGVDGVVDDLGAIITSYVNPLAFSIVTVSTVPLADLGALINYGTLVPCAPTSSVSSLGGYVRVFLGCTSGTLRDLGASVNALSVTSGLPGEILGRKRTRIRILNLTFRSWTRATVSMLGSITPVVPTFVGLSAGVMGISHEVNFTAAIVPVSYAPHDIDFTAIERVANLTSGTIKEILVSFRSQVNAYVYEDITSAVYSTDRGTWAIDLRTLIEGDSFFDRSLLNRTILIEEVQEFYSLDEAIRNAISVLCDQRQGNFGANLTVRGAVVDMGGSLGILSADRMGNLLSALVAVANSPDISASINLGPDISGFQALVAVVIPRSFQVVGNIGGSIVGRVSGDLSAGITAL